MMPRKRSKLEIIEDILEYLANEGGSAPATRIATATGLAYDRLASLLDTLNEKEIVEVRVEENRREVHLTEKGYQLLNTLRTLKRVIRDFGLDL